MLRPSTSPQKKTIATRPLQRGRPMHTHTVTPACDPLARVPCTSLSLLTPTPSCALPRLPLPARPAAHSHRAAPARSRLLPHLPCSSHRFSPAAGSPPLIHFSAANKRHLPLPFFPLAAGSTPRRSGPLPASVTYTAPARPGRPGRPQRRGRTASTAHAADEGGTAPQAGRRSGRRRLGRGQALGQDLILVVSRGGAGARAGLIQHVPEGRGRGGGRLRAVATGGARQSSAQRCAVCYDLASSSGC